MTATVFVVSTFLPERYEATARILMDDRPGAFEPGDVETVERRLATIREIVISRRVRERAASVLDNESATSLEEKVSASVDQDANLVDVRATDSDPAGAAGIANAIARSFLVLDAAGERQRLARARAQLQRSLEQARGSQERRVIRERLSELNVSEASVGSELVLAEAAEPPSDASSPRPVRNAVLAFFGSVFLAVLAALGLGQLAPRVTGPRELSTLTGAPVVAAVRTGPGRRNSKRLGVAAYDAFRSSFAVALPRDAKVVSVAGAIPDGTTAPAALALARALAAGGAATLVVSADVRRPGLHELAGVERTPGLVDALEALAQDADEPADAILERAIVPATRTGLERLDVLPAGIATDGPSQTLGVEALDDLFVELDRLDYRYVVVETPALLGAVDGPLVAEHADVLLVLCHLDRLTPTNAVELRELLARLGVDAAGLVALGADVRSDPTSLTPWPRASTGVPV